MSQVHTGCHPLWPLFPWLLAWASQDLRTNTLEVTRVTPQEELPPISGTKGEEHIPESPQVTLGGSLSPGVPISEQSEFCHLMWTQCIYITLGLCGMQHVEGGPKYQGGGPGQPHHCCQTPLLPLKKSRPARLGHDHEARGAQEASCTIPGA